MNFEELKAYYKSQGFGDEETVPLDFLLREVLYKLGGKLKMFYNI